MKMKKMTKPIHIESNMHIKGIDEDDSIIVEGYANTTSKDRVGDVVLEEAWTKGGLDNYLKNPIILAYHKYDQPIGSMVEYGINNKGLHIAAKITKSAGNVYDLIKSEVLKTFSIGFMVKDADYDTTTDIFVIKDLELHEISVVSVPANADSTFSVRKSFENDTEYNEFKDSLIKVDEKSTNNKGDTNVPEPKKDENKISLTPEELKAQTDAAIAKAFADAKAKADADEAAKAIAIEAGKTGAEDLIKEFEARMAEEKATMQEALEGLRTEVAEKSAEIQAIQKSKMSFQDGGRDDIRKLSDLEIDTAVLVAKAVNKKIGETDYFSDLKVKRGDHLADMTDDSYETIYSTRMYDEIQDKLVMEPLFTNKIAMTSRSMVFPFNPQAGYASWIVDTKYKSAIDPSGETIYASGADISGNLSSTGPARTHAISDITIKAEKLASKEPIGYEEEEDAIIPIVPIVTAAIAKRMARTTDTELLRANAGAATHADIGVAPASIDGVAVKADDMAAEYVQAGTYGASNPVTIADLQQTRRKMGPWGLNPMDVVYVVNESVYWDLLEDPDFRTMDLVGSNATILRGQVGQVNGSPVIVSDSFAAPGVGEYAAIALNVNNYLFGELRGLTTERDKDVLNQKNWIVTTRRFAFNDIDATQPSCAVLKYPAS
jgi:HK97 family phage prohead protease